MRKRDRLRPRSPAVGAIALRPRATAKPIRLSSYAVYPAQRHSARKEPGPRGRARPIPEKPKGHRPTASRKPILENAALHEVFVGGAHKVAVDAPGRNLLPVASLQGLVSRPRTSGPSPTNVSRSNPNNTRLASRPEQRARLRTRWSRWKRFSRSKPI